MNIRGRIVTLRAIEPADAPLLHVFSNDPDIWPLLGGWHFPYSSASTQQWVQKLDTGSTTHQVLAIDVPQIGLVGTVNLVQIDWKNRSAFHGTMIGRDEWRGKGFALDAVMALMRYAFDELGLERLDTDIIETNPRSLAFYTKKCGWVVEGQKRNAYFRQGKWLGKHILGITKDEYRAHAAATRYWER